MSNFKIHTVESAPEASKPMLDPSNVTQLVLFIAKPTATHIFAVSNVRAEGAVI